MRNLLLDGACGFNYLDIKNGTLVRGSSESFGLYVCPGTIISDYGCISEGVSIRGCSVGSKVTS